MCFPNRNENETKTNTEPLRTLACCTVEITLARTIDARRSPNASAEATRTDRSTPAARL